jgi:dihydrofolate reductase
MATLYNVVSSDGFIARNDGSEDFIPDHLWVNFLNLCKEYGAIIMGRKTYDSIQTYPKELIEPFEKLPIRKIVVTNNRSFHPKPEYMVVHSTKDALAIAPDALITSGPTLNNFLLEHHLVKRIILHEVPVSIQTGIKPFDMDKLSLAPIEHVAQLEGVKVYEYRILNK